MTYYIHYAGTNVMRVRKWYMTSSMNETQLSVMSIQ